MPVLISGRGDGLRRHQQARRASSDELSAVTPSESAPSDSEQRQAAGWSRQDSFRSTYDGERTHSYATFTTEEDALQEAGEEERIRNMRLELMTLEGPEQEQFLRFSTPSLLTHYFSAVTVHHWAPFVAL